MNRITFNDGHQAQPEDRNPLLHFTTAADGQLEVCTDDTLVCISSMLSFIQMAAMPLLIDKGDGGPDEDWRDFHSGDGLYYTMLCIKHALDRTAHYSSKTDGRLRTIVAEHAELVAKANQRFAEVK